MSRLGLSAPNPVWFLAFGVAGFAAWVAFDNTRPPVQTFSGRDSLDGEPDLSYGGTPSPAVAHLLARVHPGMPRVVFEQHFCTVTPAEFMRVDESLEPPLRRLCFRIHLSSRLPPGPTQGPAPGPFLPRPYLVICCFDESLPHQPLVGLSVVPDVPAPAIPLITN